jgi:subtilisin family serine protease
MRWFAAALVLFLVPPNSFGQADCVEGMVILRLTSTQTTSPGLLAASPPQFGIASVDEVLAQYDPTVIRPFLVSASGAAQSAAVDRLMRTWVVYYSDEENPHAVVAELSSSPAIEAVFVNGLVTKYYGGTERVEPDDTEFENQWNLDNDDDRVDIDAPEAWAIEAGDSSLVIGVIDLGTMVDVGPEGIESEEYTLHPDNTFFFNDHEDVSPKRVLGVDDLNGLDGADPFENLADNVIGYRFPPVPDGLSTYERRFWRSVPHNWNSTSAPITYQRHGVFVASIVAAKATGGANIAGVANNCKVYILRDGVGVGSNSSGQAEETDAILNAAEFSRVINMSWSFHTEPLGPFSDAIDVAIAKDCVLVASAGNIGQGPGTIAGWPARYPDVLCLGNMTPSLILEDSSRFGPTVGIVDLVAPVGDDGIPVNSHDDELQPTVATLDGTSAAAPQAAGVAALVRSRFPGLTQDQVRQRMKASAEWYWGSTSTDQMMYGSGKLNAYRAISEWGSVNGSVTWTKNTLTPYLDQGGWVSRPGSRDGMYYVSGDLTIETGATLTIAAGTVIKVAPDHEGAGTDPYRVQIVVKGTLNIAGTSSNPVVFEGFTDSTPTNNDWLGIQFEPGSSGTISHAVIRNAITAIRSYVPLTVDHVTIENGSQTGIHAFAGLTISNSTLRDILYPAIKIESGNLTATNVEIYNSSYGIVGGTGTGTISITDCNFHDLDYRGIEFQNQMGSLTISQTTVEDCQDGVLIGAHSSGLIDECTIRRNDIGIWTTNSTGLFIKHCEIDSNTTNGIYSVLSQATVEADTISHSAVGAFFNTYSGGSVIGGTLITSNAGGIKCDITSNPTIRHTRITANTNGVTAHNNSAPNLGVASSGEECDASGPNIGNNSIHNNSSYHVTNFSAGITIVAEGNWWNADPPHASKFYGLVSYEPYLCTNPNPVSPWDGTDPGPEDKPGSTLPTRYSLGASQPNPFNPVTTMTFDVPAPGGEVEIAIFDVKGAKVRTLVQGRHDAGTHSATWTGRGDSGEPVASGVYFVRMTAPSFTQTRKVVLLK